MLLNLGVEIVFVEDGKRVFEFVCLDIFDFIIMDVFMLVMDGVEVIKVIWLYEIGNKLDCILIIVFMVYFMVGDWEKFLDVDMDDYLSKFVIFEGI